MDPTISFTSNPPYRPFTDAAVEDRGAWFRLQPNVTATDKDGSILYEQRDFTLLCTIVSYNDTRALREYLANGSWAVPRAPDIPSELIGDTLRGDYFHNAAADGCLGTLQMLLARGIKENIQSPARIRFKHRGYELLHVAVKWGHIDVAQFLLQNQPLYADIHERDPKGRTPILVAADFYATKFLAGEGGDPARNERVVNLLLDYGACATDVIPSTYEDKPAETVLTLAARWAGPELIKRLTGQGADVHTKVEKAEWRLDFWNNHEITEVDALFIACTCANFDAVKTLIGILQVTMQAEEISHLQDSRGSLLIHWATQNDTAHRACYDWLLKERVPNITKIVDFLLSLNPTTVNAQDNEGNTPLHYATRAMGRHKGLFAPVFTFLCDRGADASIRNNKGQTPLHTLLKVEKDEIRRYTCFESEFVLDTSAVLTLLAHGASATDADNDGNTPLHFIAEILNYSNGLSLLLEHGADPTLQNEKGETAVHRAARGSYLTMAWRIEAPERIVAQDEVIGMLVKVGGQELMDLMDADGKSPRKVCEETREAWREHDIPAWKRQQNRFGRIPRGGASRGGRGGRGG
ncbi:unnamed protein product [Fusarium equiseti]|uniref:Ankyrin n=1 Tax=Fusarium equiseti TaxID=61235 RepID=A0A8J2NGP6_FUSEQ|nr:unnamed protein product [Fusarium equiseti]